MDTSYGSNRSQGMDYGKLNAQNQGSSKDTNRSSKGSTGAGPEQMNKDFSKDYSYIAQEKGY